MRTARCLLLTTFLLVGPRGATAQGRAAAKDPLEGLAAYVEQMRQDWKVPGLALAIVRDDSIVFSRGFGVRELGRPEPVDEHTLFAIASCTKAFTATLVGLLVSEGKLAWDDRAADRLPGFRLADPYVSQEITLRDLLSHRSGLARGDRIWYASPFDRDEVLHRVRYLEPSWSFRSAFGYQNIMFIAAGEAAARAAGTTWDQLVRQRLFLPLGMLETNTSVSALQGLADVATPHDEIRDTIRPIAWRNFDNIGGAGTINSSIADMAQWVRLQLRDGQLGDRRIVDSATIAETHAPQTVIPRTGLLRSLVSEGHFYAYGLGWFLQDYRGRLVLSHGGNLDGMSAMVALMPEERVGFVLLSNLESSPLRTPLMYRIFDGYLGGPRRDWSREWKAATDSITREGKEQEARDSAARVPGTSPSVAPERLAGRYTSKLFPDYVISVEDGGLVARQGPFLTGDLEHWHYDTWRITWRNPSLGRTFVTFRLSPRGAPQELVTGLDDGVTFRRAEP